MTQPHPTPHGQTTDRVDEHVIRTYQRSHEVFVGGRGATLIDRDGREFIDFLAGIAVSALGHAYPPLIAAVSDQVGRIVHSSNLLRHPYTEAVASRIAELTGLEASFFTNSGTEANEAALKLARKVQKDRGQPDRVAFVALHAAFHGRSMGALSCTHAEKYRKPFGPLLPVTFVPQNDVDALAAAIRDTRPAAFLCEPIQGEGGILELAAEFLAAARELCDETGTVLVHDEVQSGSGRTGKFLASQWHGVAPDVVTLAKPIAGGLPMGMMTVRAELADVLKPGDHGSTFAGGPLVCRAALVLLDALRDGLLDNVQARGRELRDGLLALQQRHSCISAVRGRGLLLGLRLSRGAPELHKEHHRRRGRPRARALRARPRHPRLNCHHAHHRHRLRDPAAQGPAVHRPSRPGRRRDHLPRQRDPQGRPRGLHRRAQAQEAGDAVREGEPAHALHLRRRHAGPRRLGGVLRTPPRPPRQP
jgi:acetylornithine aminotransferase/acetylornithine/N-succinyldiaminopimelate aminotransferase